MASRREKTQKQAEKKAEGQPAPIDDAALYRAVIDAMQDPVHMLDADLRMVFCNAAIFTWLKRLGYAGDIRGKLLFDIFTFLKDSQRQEYQRVLQNGQPLTSDDFTTINGQTIVVETQKIPLCNSAGKVTHIVTVIHDISQRAYTETHFKNLNTELEQRVEERTGKLQAANRRLQDEIYEREAAEEDLRQQSLFAEALANTAADLNSTLELEPLLDRILANIEQVVPHDAADIMLIEDGAARIVRARGYELHGDPERVLALKFTVSQTSNMASMFQNGQTVLIPDVKEYPGWVDLAESAWIHSHVGAPILMEGSVVGFLNVDSAQPCFFTAAHASRLKVFAEQAGLAIKNARLYAAARHELEERRRAQEALSESQERFNSLFSQAAVSAADAEGRFIQASQPLLDLLGYTRDELLGMTFQEITHPDDLDLDIDNVRLMNSGELNSFIIDKRYLHKNGSAVWTNINVSAVRDAGGRVRQTIAVVQDIGQRKTMEEKLRLGEERYRSLFEQGAVSESDIQGYFINASQACCDLLGYAPEELSRLTFQEITHPDDLQADLELTRQARSHLIDSFVIEKRFIRKDGGVVWTNLHVSPLWDENGAPKGDLALLQDITDRKRTEEALRESEALFRTTFETSAIGTSLADLDGYFLLCNPAIKKIFGYTPEEMHGKHIREISYPEDANKDLDLYRELLEGKRNSYRIEKRNIHKDGRVVWGELVCSVVRDPQGKPLYTIGMFDDITERKMGEEALRQSEELFRQFFELSPIGISIANIQGRYLRVNPAFCTMTGYSESELVKLTYQDVSYPDPAEIETNRILREKLIRGDLTDFEMEKRFVTRDKRIIDVILHLTIARDSEDTPLYLIGQMFDITERKKMESEMLSSQKMAGLGTLAAGIAHELNTPLQIVTAASENLLKKLDEGTLEEDKLRRSLTNINQSAWRMAETIRSLRLYTRSTDEVFEQHTLNEIVRDTLLLIEHQLKTWSNIRIETRLGENLPPFRCVRNKVSQALINLLTNARDAMPGGGKIIVETAHEPENHLLLLRVSDNGEGIALEVQKRIFDPFYTTKGVGKGTGLGLSIVLGIVRSHAGEIKLKSAPGAGAEFTLSFPENPEGSGASLLDDPFAGTFDD